MINAATLANLKDGVRIINLARADLVNAADMKAALESGKMAAYVTDFPTEDVLGVPGVVAIPHLGASTAEAEDNCAVMAAVQLDDYLRYGNIKNSVNFPNVAMPVVAGHKRICILHANVPAVIAGITTVLSDTGANIENMINKSKGDNAYTLVDFTGDLADGVVEKITAITGVVRVRVI